jgi:tRNA-2-methylthio-N6-dimethylallyladenosine synthase
LGARNVSKITQVLDKKGAVEIDTSFDESAYAFSEFRTSSFKAMVNISIGCDKQCTFCIVPATRGAEIAIPSHLIVQEARKAAQAGAKEIFLLGQNVNNYNHEGKDFSDLLELVSEIEEVERIRFTSPHPLHMDDKFLEVFASNPKICKSMHMPLQSGSTRLLKEMKRGYSKEWFLNRAKKLREMVPDVHISTDIIVGFPGESDADFEETMDVINQVRFEQIFSFKYSPRPLTKAAEFENIVDSAVASERLTRVQARQDELLDEIAQAADGKIYEVYFEELRNNGGVAGRAENSFMVQVDGSEELLGLIKKVRITNPRRKVLYGEVAE